jgi:hypothetical protein
MLTPIGSTASPSWWIRVVRFPLTRYQPLALAAALVLAATGLVAYRGAVPARNGA